MHQPINIRLLTILLLSISFPVWVMAQLGIVPENEIRLWQNGEKLVNPWAGGFNTPQFSEMDL
ncbi:MAG: hypothetical protein AB7D35_13655, partial [Bacteroidales bacterium]